MLKRSTSLRLYRLPRSFLQGAACGHAGLLLLHLSQCLAGVRTSHAQAIPAADKTGQINAFGTYTLTAPDYSNQKRQWIHRRGRITYSESWIFGQPAVCGRDKFQSVGAYRERILRRRRPGIAFQNCLH